MSLWTIRVMGPDTTSRCSDPGERHLLVAFDAVLNVHQLPEVRHIVGARVDGVCPDVSNKCRLALQELCLAVLERSGLCVGLRVYSCAGGVRVEVDEPHTIGGDVLRSAHGIVETLAAGCGAAGPDAEVRTGVDPRPETRTIWCELSPAVSAV